MQQPVHQAELRMQHEFPDDRHRDQRRHDRQEVDGAVPGAEGTAALDQQRDAEPERHRCGHHDRHVGQGVSERGPEHPVGQHLPIVLKADPRECGASKLVVGERQRDDAKQRSEQQQAHQHEGGRHHRQRRSRAARALRPCRRDCCRTAFGGKRVRGEGISQRLAPARVRCEPARRPRCVCRRRRIFLRRWPDR